VTGRAPPGGRGGRGRRGGGARARARRPPSFPPSAPPPPCCYGSSPLSLGLTSAPLPSQFFETFSYLPPLDDAAVAKQVDYITR